MSVDFVKIAEKWQKKWEEDNIFKNLPKSKICEFPSGNKNIEAEQEKKDKFFITAAFPYLNGVLHAGHLRTFTIPEIMARYQRMNNKTVLWTFGFHVSGTPIIGLAELLKKQAPETIWAYNKLHNIPMEELQTLTTPENIVNYFSKKATESFKKMGFALDWRRNFKTDDETFKKFVEWQFLKLKEKNLIVKGSHPVRYCPSCDNPVEDHDLLKGEEATLQEYILLKFKTKLNIEIDNENKECECIIPMATLRPETIYGVVNAWINPNDIYHIIKVHNEVQSQEEGSDEITLKYNGIWIVSKEASDKLKNQDRAVELIKEIKGEELVGKIVINPVNNKEVPLYPADFVSSEMGTGCVMSVPAHAPKDFVALRDYYNSINKELTDEELISLIKIEGYGKYPAKEIVEKMGITNQKDEKLEDATHTIYKQEFHKGILNENCGEYEGVAVRDIKDKLAKDFINNNIAETLQEFSIPEVVCRCGEKCVVKTVKGQWFITYSNEEWKKKAHDWVDKMNFVPETIRVDFHNKIDWMKDKACARKKGLGTRFPFDKDWVIESLSDSTLYMAYYTVAKTINTNNLLPEQLIPELFDYVYYGKGDINEISNNTKIPVDLINEMRNEFEYYYPLDWRCSAKDLVPNHLTFMIFNHVALFDDEKYYPKGIVVNGYVTIEGKKLSKSKGPVLPIEDVAKNYGPDVGRFYITTCAELPHDADVKFKEMEHARDNLIRFYELATELIEQNPKDFVALRFASKDTEKTITELSTIDKWLLHKTHSDLKIINESYKEFQFRRIGTLFYGLTHNLKWYKRRGGNNNQLLKYVVEIWTKILAPITPHLCEEIWEMFGYNKNNNYISNETFPQPNNDYINEDYELGEEFIKNTMDDIKNIINIANITPKTIYLYTSDSWKFEVLKIMVENKGAPVNKMMPLIMKNAELRRYGKEIPKLINEIIKNGISDPIDEENILNDAKQFFENEFQCKIIVNGDDIGNKKRFAIPNKVAIYIE